MRTKSTLSACLLIPIFLLILASCTSTPQPPTQPETQPVLEVMVHDSFAVSESVIQTFEQDNQVTVRFIKSGDTGTALNKAILSKEKPLADVFYGIDDTFLSRALAEGIFESYNSPLLTEIPPAFQLDPENRALPVNYGDVCLNYDKAYFAERNLAIPESLDDLLKPQYKGLLVVQNPATSSPGLAFLLATISAYGEDQYLEFWQKLATNGVLVVNDWETAYYSEFSGSSGKGPRPLVVSYNSSPAVELLYAESPLDEPSTAAIVSDNTCYRQIEFVGILKGTDKRQLAEKWVDFMLSATFQEDLPLQMFVFPTNPTAHLEDIFIRFLAIPEQTAQVAPELIAQNREKWLADWTQAVLR
jgi:thiamine transport system substrate-binding protein